MPSFIVRQKRTQIENIEIERNERKTNQCTAHCMNCGRHIVVRVKEVFASITKRNK